MTNHWKTGTGHLICIYIYTQYIQYISYIQRTSLGVATQVATLYKLQDSSFRPCSRKALDSRPGMISTIDLLTWKNGDLVWTAVPGVTRRYTSPFPSSLLKIKIMYLGMMETSGCSSISWSSLRIPDVAYRTAPCLGRVSQCQPVWKWMWIHDILWK